MENTNKSGQGIAKPVTRYGYVLNYSGMKKPVYIYIRYFIRPIRKSINFPQSLGVCPIR